MSKYAGILADIKTRLESVPGIGNVYDYDRWSADIATFINFFSYTPQGGEKHIRGWEITRSGFSEHRSGAFFRHHKFVIKGYMGLKDSAGTEKVFQGLVEDVCEIFRAAQTAVDETWEYMDGDNSGNSPIQGGTIEARMYGSILCHHAVLTLSVTERILA